MSLDQLNSKEYIKIIKELKKLRESLDSYQETIQDNKKFEEEYLLLEKIKTLKGVMVAYMGESMEEPPTIGLKPLLDDEIDLGIYKQKLLELIKQL